MSDMKFVDSETKDVFESLMKPGSVQIGDTPYLESAYNYRKIEWMNTIRSFNNRLILAPYAEERVLKAKESNGFAMLAQKSSIVGLGVLVDCKLSDSTFIQAGSTAYIKEQLLYTQEWAKQVLESKEIEGKFIIVDLVYVDFIKPREV